MKKLLFLFIILFTISSCSYQNQNIQQVKNDLKKENIFTYVDEYDEFSSCLNKSDVKMYCSWWSQGCLSQTEEFEIKAEVFRDIGVRIECSIGGSQKITNDICIDKKIDTFPTWEINGERITKIISLNELSDKTGCIYPIVCDEVKINLNSCRNNTKINSNVLNTGKKELVGFEIQYEELSQNKITRTIEVDLPIATNYSFSFDEVLGFDIYPIIYANGKNIRCINKKEYTGLALPSC